MTKEKLKVVFGLLAVMLVAGLATPWIIGFMKDLAGASLEVKKGMISFVGVMVLVFAALAFVASVRSNDPSDPRQRDLWP